MKLSDAIQLARLTVIEAEAHGFEGTAKAMQDVLDQMLLIQVGRDTTQERSSEYLQALAAWH